MQAVVVANVWRVCPEAVVRGVLPVLLRGWGRGWMRVRWQEG